MELISPVKRDRMKKIAKLKLKKDMREALPILNKQEIRRFRIPYNEAILIESLEDGYTSTSDFLRQLFQHQEDLIKEHGIESVVATRPQLVSSREQLDILYSGLKCAESSHYNDNIDKEIDELIKMGALYGFGSINWWWLGEQLLIQANNVSSNYLKDGGKRNAIAKYIYGKFLYENLADAEQAKEKLIISRQLSMGKSWNAKNELQCKQDTIFTESCILLCKSLLAEARKTLSVDPLKASRICVIARKRAADACDHVGEAEALMLEGLCEVQAGDSSAALRAFIKVLQLYIAAENKEGICEARIYMGLAYLKIGKVEESLTQLNALLEFAQTHELPYYIAQAYRFLGEYYLNQGQPEEATPRLIQALTIFHEIEDFPNREQARNLAAISAGQELLPKYVSLILKCGKRDTDVFASLLKLLKWKDVREIFWDDVEEVESKSSLATEQSFEVEMNVEQMEIDEMNEEEEEFQDESDEVEVIIRSSDIDSIADAKSIQSDAN